MKQTKRHQLEVNLALPSLFAATPSGQLSHEEAGVMDRAKENATSNLAIFLNLLESAQLEHSESWGQRLSKIFLFIVGQRRSILIHVFDPESGTRFDLNFSFPLRIFQLLIETPILQVLESEPAQLAKQMRMPEIFIKRLTDDIRVFKIVFAYKGQLSSKTRLIDLT